MDKLEKAVQEGPAAPARGSRDVGLQAIAGAPSPAVPVTVAVADRAAVAGCSREPCVRRGRAFPGTIARRRRAPNPPSQNADIVPPPAYAGSAATWLKSDHRSLAITSPHYGDGKTTVACNLALSIAQDVKQTVLLVDLDLRKPDLHRYLGLDAPYGLSDYLIKDVPLSKCLVRSTFDRFSILPAGHSLDNSSEVLGSPKMAALAVEMEQRYDDRLVIYDMPPLLDQDDSMAFFPHVGSVLLVVRDGVTPINDVRRSLNALSSTRLIGTVLNRSTM